MNSYPFLPVQQPGTPMGSPSTPMGSPSTPMGSPSTPMGQMSFGSSNLMAPEPYLKCTYKTGKCNYPRTWKRNKPELHSLCEYHRLKRNAEQRKSDRLHKRRQLRRRQSESAISKSTESSKEDKVGKLACPPVVSTPRPRLKKQRSTPNLSPKAEVKIETMSMNRPTLDLNFELFGEESKPSALVDSLLDFTWIEKKIEPISLSQTRIEEETFIGGVSQEDMMEAFEILAN